MEPCFKKPTRVLLFLSICNNISQIFPIFKQHSHRWMLQRATVAVGHPSKVNACTEIRRFCRRPQVPSELFKCNRHTDSEQHCFVFERWYDVFMGHKTIQQANPHQQDICASVEQDEQACRDSSFRA